MMDDAVQLDLRRVIGSLDPEEMAVLYDYAPLFLDQADEAANSVLRAAADAGWSWEIVELGLRSDAEDDLATVFLESMHFRADAENGGLLDVRIGADEFGVEFVSVDEFFGNEFRLAVELDGECIEFTVDEGSGSQTERLCGEELGLGTAGLGELGDGLGDQFDSVGIVTREVDGVWYVSPIRTGLDAIIATLEQVEPETLRELADEALSLGLDGGFMVPDLESALPLPGATDDEFLWEASDARAGAANADLLAETLDPTFVWDLDAAASSAEAAFWVPDLTDIAFERGIYATVPAPGGGDVAIVSLEVADFEQAEAAFERLAEAAGGEVEARSSFGPYVIETVDQFGGPMFVESFGVRLVIVGVIGADVEDARRVLDQQSGS